MENTTKTKKQRTAEQQKKYEKYLAEQKKLKEQLLDIDAVDMVSEATEKTDRQFASVFRSVYTGLRKSTSIIFNQKRLGILSNKEAVLKLETVCSQIVDDIRKEFPSYEEE